MSSRITRELKICAQDLKKKIEVGYLPKGKADVERDLIHLGFFRVTFNDVTKY